MNGQISLKSTKADKCCSGLLKDMQFCCTCVTKLQSDRGDVNKLPGWPLPSSRGKNTETTRERSQKKSKWGNRKEKPERIKDVLRREKKYIVPAFPLFGFDEYIGEFQLLWGAKTWPMIWWIGLNFCGPRRTRGFIYHANCNKLRVRITSCKAARSKWSVKVIWKV